MVMQTCTGRNVEVKTVYVVNVGGRERRMVYLANGKLMGYPRFLLEIDDPDLEVHHIDGDTLNDDYDNLQVMKRSRHKRMHAKRYWLKNPCRVTYCRG